MTDFTHIAEQYVIAWNEADPRRRRALLAEGWDEGASYVDPQASAAGLDEIAALIGAVQERFAGFRFALDGPVDGHGETLRFSWTLGPAHAADLIRGTDFATLKAGRLASVTGFLDRVPQAA